MANGNRQQTVVAEIEAQGRPDTRRPDAGVEAVPGGERVPLFREGLSWRARMGIVIPQLDLLTEPLLARILPPGISFHTSRLRRTGPTSLESLHEMNRHFESALTLLPLPYLDIVVYHCTMGSLCYDPEKLVRDIETRTRLPGVVTLQAAQDALHHLGTRRISLVTPYPRDFNEAETEFLEEREFSVVSVGGEPFDDAGTMAMVSPDEISLWVRRARRPETDAVFISCTGIRSLEFIDALEDDLGVPVVTSTSAMLWQVFRKLGLNQTMNGLGVLLRQRTP